MAAAAAGAIKRLLTLGTCVPCMNHNASKIRIKTLELDTNLLMYFRKEEFVYAYDPKKICKTGDVVLVRQLEEKKTPTLTHEVMEVVYPLGNVTDPITGKTCVAGKYRDDIEKESARFGRLESSFEYRKAPRRGWQEDKKDFSHRKTYVKYNVFDNDDQPFAVRG